MSLFQKKRRPTQSEIRADVSRRLLSDDSPFSIVEAYRLARTNLIYSSGKEGTPIYAITSAIPNEGKSLNSANLSIAFAQSGMKTLLIDCDMRNPTQQTAFGIKTKNGLSEYLAGVREDVLVQKTRYENLSIIVAGKTPPNAAELLSSPRLEQLLLRAAEEYDCVFLDLPPLAVVSDALILADKVTGYVIVVNSGNCDSRTLSSALASLEQVGGTVVGTILNGVQAEGHRRYGYRYGNYKYGYGRYGRYGGYSSYGDAPSRGHGYGVRVEKK